MTTTEAFHVVCTWNFGEFETTEQVSPEQFAALVRSGKQDGQDEVTSVTLFCETTPEFRQRWEKR